MIFKSSPLMVPLEVGSESVVRMLQCLYLEKLPGGELAP